jgi:rare lipoprotein A
VTNLENGRSAVVRVNDRGPFVHNRVIDLSYAAAKQLGMVENGVAQVEVRSIDPRDHGGDVEAALRLASTDVTAAPARASLAGGASGNEMASAVYLQLGAFDERDNAERLRKQVLASVDVPVRVRAATSGAAADSLYRVQIGPLRSEGDADSLGRRLAALGLEKPLIVSP